MDTKLSIETPLQLSLPLSKCVSHDVYLKLENTQPCNSFKIRGFERLCQKKYAEGSKGFATFSGGNAGIALAYLTSKLKLPCHIFLPSYVSKRILQKMETLGAKTHVVGTAKEAFEATLAFTKSNRSITFVHPYDDEELWNGYAEIVTEIKQQLQTQFNGTGKPTKPSAIVLSVGGGGLLMGIIKGLNVQGWKGVPILAMETVGAEKFHKSIKAGRIIENELTSIAKTLGAHVVASNLIELLPKYKIIPEILPDNEAVKACLQFADDHAYLVEPSCGVSLAAIYNGILGQALEKTGLTLGEGPIVVIVCGGSDTSVEILGEYARTVGLEGYDRQNGQDDDLVGKVKTAMRNLKLQQA